MNSSICFLWPSFASRVFSSFLTSQFIPFLGVNRGQRLSCQILVRSTKPVSHTVSEVRNSPQHLRVTGIAWTLTEVNAQPAQPLPEILDRDHPFPWCMSFLQGVLTAPGTGLSTTLQWVVFHLLLTIHSHCIDKKTEAQKSELAQVTLHVMELGVSPESDSEPGS